MYDFTTSCIHQLLAYSNLKKKTYTSVRSQSIKKSWSIRKLSTHAGGHVFQNSEYCFKTCILSLTTNIISYFPWRVGLTLFIFEKMCTQLWTTMVCQTFCQIKNSVPWGRWLVQPTTKLTAQGFEITTILWYVVEVIYMHFS